MIQPFNRQRSHLAEFFVIAAQSEDVAPATGTQTMRIHYEELAS